MVDSSGRSRFVAGLVAQSGDLALMPKLSAYAAANLGATDRRPIDQAIGRIRWTAGNQPRIRQETVAWLKSHAG